jgi:hypothetical protein
MSGTTHSVSLLRLPARSVTWGETRFEAPRFFNTHFALLKDTRVQETLTVQFRAEFFNIFNHTNLGLPVTGIGGDSLFVGAGGRDAAAGQN